MRSPKGAPLPITETGFRSAFLDRDAIAAAGGVVDYVRAWLDREAASKAWTVVEQKWRQLELELLPPRRSPASPRRRPKPPTTKRAGQGSA